MNIHPIATIIKELNFNGRNITFKATDLEDRMHIYNIYSERGVDVYDHTGLPYFICCDFRVYKNEFNFDKLESNTVFIIKMTPTRKHKFPNNIKIKLHKFKPNIKIFHYNKIEPRDYGYSNLDIFNEFCKIH